VRWRRTVLEFAIAFAPMIVAMATLIVVAIAIGAFH
jgi:hypothetical protein